MKKPIKIGDRVCFVGIALQTNALCVERATHLKSTGQSPYTVCCTGEEGKKWEVIYILDKDGPEKYVLSRRQVTKVIRKIKKNPDLYVNFSEYPLRRPMAFVRKESAANHANFNRYQTEKTIRYVAAKDQSK